MSNREKVFIGKLFVILKDDTTMIAKIFLSSVTTLPITHLCRLDVNYWGMGHDERPCVLNKQFSFTFVFIKYLNMY